MTITVGTILKYLQQHAVLGEIEFRGSKQDLSIEILGLSSTTDTKSTHLVCVFKRNLYPQLETFSAAAMITPQDAPQHIQTPVIAVADPYLAYAYTSQLFVEATPKQGVHETATIAASANIHPSAYVGPYAVVEAGAEIGENASIGAHCFLGKNSSIGHGTYLHPRVNIYPQVKIGARCILHSGAVIGADGFGFAPQAAAQSQGRMWQKIAQLGSVDIGNDVEIGANTTIDRGAIEDTIIGHGVIIDNQVQIAHNVRIGNNTAIAGCVGIAGSSVIGENCRLAGGVGIAGHLEIANGVVITGMSMVTKSITHAGSYSSGTPLQETRTWRKNAARFARLDQTFRKKQKVKK